MKKIGFSPVFVLIALGLLFSCSQAEAETLFSGVINTDTTWTKANSPYVTESGIVVRPGATLTLEPGVVIKFHPGRNLEVDGTLRANGTGSDKIYFTSIEDDDVGGDTNGDGTTSSPAPKTWHNIRFNSNSTGELENVVVRYAGFLGPFAGIYNNGGNVNISDSIIRGNGDQGIVNSFGNLSIESTEIFGQLFGVTIFQGSVNISNSNIHDNINNGITTQSSASTLNLNNNIFRDNGLAAFVWGRVNFSHSDNTSSGNGINGFVMGGNIPSDQVWKKDNMPYVVDSIFVDSGAILTIEPGVIVKFNEGRSMEVNGTLEANGTKDEKIYFTSVRDDQVGGDTNGDGDATQPAPRDWFNVKFNNANATLSNVIYQYAGAPGGLFSNVGIYNNNSNVSISDSQIAKNGDQGVFQRFGSLNISSSEISDHNYGLHIQGGSTEISNSNFLRNDIAAIHVDAPLAAPVNAKNNYWGDPTGPQHPTSNPGGLGNAVSDQVDFIPFCTSPESCGALPPPSCIENCFSNVLFLPGLKGSRLYELRADGSEDQLWEPNISSDIDELYLNSNGTSSNQEVYTREIIHTTNIGLGILDKNFYKGFAEMMGRLMDDAKVNVWEPYAYDWRQGVADIIENGTKYKDGKKSLINTLQSLADSSKNGKVIIVAHSNGGLLAKALVKKLTGMKSLGQSDLIDKIDTLILVASPQVGTPDAISALLHGYKQSMPLGVMSEIQAREMAINMSSVYGLLPSKKYYEQSGLNNPVIFNINSPQGNFYGSSINSYQEQHDFVLGQEGRTQPNEIDLLSPIIGNNILLSRAEDLHDDIDNIVFPPTMKVINIAGWGKNTISGIVYTGSDIQPIFTFRGDKTVVMQSALQAEGKNYWLDLSNSKLNHGTILEDPELLDFIKNTIEGKNSNLPDQEPNVSNSRLHLSVHSPVTIEAYDDQRNFTGKVCDDSGTCGIIEDIPGSSYFDFGEGKYVNISQDKLDKVTLQGTGVGTFTFDSDLVEPNGQTTSYTFIDIPVTTQTQGEITFNSTGTPQLGLDVTGDGVKDFTLAPTDTFDPVTYLQIMKATVNSLNLPQARKIAFEIRVNNIIKAIQNGKIDKAKLRAERFQAALEKKISKPDPKKSKPKKLSKTDAQMLLDMLNKLLDNLDK